MTDKEKHRQYLNLLLLQDKNLGSIYSKMASELSVILRRYKVGANSKVWHKNAQIKKEVDAVLSKYRTIIFSNISTASATAWELSDKHNDSLVEKFTKGLKLTEKQQKNYFNRNAEALKAFQQRSRDGFKLSDRVWNLTDQTRGQLETFIGTGLTSGRSAASLARDIQGYLKEPDKRFRRVKHPITGKLVISAPGKDYHPGQGVYRSSHKNALRLARNEINIAYRTADIERRKQLDFVTGIQVHLSPAHLQYDICDELQGEYPKGFMFTGWHVNCICFTTSKMLSRKEFIEHMRSGNEIDQGKYVKTIPSNAAQYLNANAARIKGLSSKPYFIQDNFKNTKDGFELKSGDNPNKPPEIPKPVFVPIKDVKGLTDHFAGFATENPEYFARGFKYVKPTTRRGMNGYTYMNGDIYLNRSILDEVINGVNEIKATGKATLAQETALSTMHHELMHNANKVGNIKLNKIQSTTMELANEFVSRNRLPGFIEKLGGKLQNIELVSDRVNTGYNTMVRNYDHLLEMVNVDKSKALKVIEKQLINESYSKQIDGLVSAIKDNTDLDIGVRDIAALIRRTQMYDQERFKEMLGDYMKLFKSK